MIELKNINKVYKSKKGITTNALNDINLKLQDSGLTFILGKSGSGKSTLLNIIGGLDTYTSGDLIINGKSSKEFKVSDWDNYRNTYIGFIFQEYNLLENYSVEENINLSLELQHKKPDSKEVLRLLELVGLDDVRKRKINELSGGQKQRIAIARSIIKNPEVILADEPTGNLDSKTSIQIFDILKKLSKEKIVIVVSHDLENAKKYADRIITLQDGNLIEDTVNVVDQNSKEYHFIKAKMPLKYSIKMALGNIWHKKLRLLFSVFFLTICLIAFGISLSPLSFDLNEEYLKSFKNNELTEITLQEYTNTYSYINTMNDSLKQLMNPNYISNIESIDNEENLAEEATKKTNILWHNSYSLNPALSDNTWYYAKTESYASLYNKSIYINHSTLPTMNSSTFADVNKSLPKDVILIGNIPENKDEIILSSYIVDSIIRSGIECKKSLEDEMAFNYYPKSYNQIISDGYYVRFNTYGYYKITGILDYNDYLKKYDDLKKTIYYDYLMMDYSSDLYKNLDSLCQNLSLDSSFLGRIYVHPSFLEQKNTKINYLVTSTQIKLDDKFATINRLGYLNNNKVLIGNNIEEINDLQTNYIAINESALNILTDNAYVDELIATIQNYQSKEEFVQAFLKKYDLLNKDVIISTLSDLNKRESETLKLAGVILDDSESQTVYYAKEKITNKTQNILSIFSTYTYVSDINSMKNILNHYPIDNAKIISDSKYASDVKGAAAISWFLKKVGTYLCAGSFIIFFLVLVSTTLNDIKFRKKEIGILRAIGCKGKDIYQMFICEMLIIVGLSLFFAFKIIPSIILAINGFVNTYTDIKIVSFGLPQISICLGIVLIIIILSSILPLKKLINSKPIDVIVGK